jgi:hypothetical protein
MTDLTQAREAARQHPAPEPGSLAAHLHDALAEVDRLTARLAAYGSPVGGGIAPPKVDLTLERQRADRAALEKGFTDQEWAVGRILCPEGFACTSHPLAVFVPLKTGRVPLHRHERFGHACPGSHQKPSTPPLRLRPADGREAQR